MKNWKLFLFLTVMASSVFAQNNPNQVYLVQSAEGEKFLLTESYPFNISGKISNGAMGICAETCSKNFNMSAAYSKNLAFSNGALDIPESLRSSYAFGSYPIEVTSEATKISDSALKITTKTKMRVADSSMEMGEEEFLIENIPLTIDLNHKDTPTSRRFEYSEVSNDLKHYSRSVFQIMGAEESDGLGGSATSHGTAFFISTSGYALTNLHVMETNPACLAKKSCQLNIKLKNEVVRNFEVATRVLTCSKLNDFCLIKIQLNGQFEITPLEMNLDKISRSLMTVGFPGDKHKEFLNESGEETNEVALTYSFGSPIGFSGTGISTSMFIFGGASGSPIIDLEDGKVIGLNSNGAQTFAMGADGMPAIIRSLYLINKEFNLQGYLNNTKQRRIESLISNLQKTEDLIEANAILSGLAAEKTYYGLGKLEVISYSHQRPSIRKAIFKYLKEINQRYM